MLIPFGTLAASGRVIGDYELISTSFGTGSSGVITFTSIQQDYKHLQIRYTAKNTSNGGNINLTMNDVTSGVYTRHLLRGNGNGVASPAGITSATFISIINTISVSTTANSFGAGVVDILDYTSTTKNKTVRALYGLVDDSTRIVLLSGLYAQTTAVSSLTLTAGANNFTSASRFSLYGIRG